MLPLGFELMRIGIGAGIYHSVERRAALLMTEGRQEETDEEQSCEKYCHRESNGNRASSFLKRRPKELGYVEWVGFCIQY